MIEKCSPFIGQLLQNQPTDGGAAVVAQVDDDGSAVLEEVAQRDVVAVLIGEDEVHRDGRVDALDDADLGAEFFVPRVGAGGLDVVVVVRRGRRGPHTHRARQSAAREEPQYARAPGSAWIRLGA